MSNGVPRTSDDGTSISPVREAKIRPAPFDLDDAFSDGDDNDGTLEFSSQALRAELSKSLSPQEVDHDGMEEVSFNGSHPSFVPDASVSTLEMNGRSDPSPSRSPSFASDSLSPSASRSSPSPISRQLSSHFDQISLSDSHPEEVSDDVHHDMHSSPSGSDVARPDARELSAVDVSAASDEQEQDDEGSSYPAVHFDASKDSAEAVDTARPRSSSSAHDDNVATSASLEAPRSAPNHVSGQRAVSTSALPIPPATAAPSLAVPPQPRPASSHRQTRSSGPSTFEKVVSRTRPSFLPPKAREEDLRHMADWEKMMKQSRAAEEKRRQALQERRLAREQKVEESLHRWERDIVPDWKVVDRNPALRKLWWAGIPTKLRASMWERAVGNALALSKDSYRICLARAKRALAAGTFPTTTLSLIEEDVNTTLPSLHIFHPETGPMYQDLKELLYAWVVARSDEGLGYVRGTSKIAAMILVNMPAMQGFVVMRNLLERHCLRSFYGGMATKDEVEAYYRIFDTLLADGMPKIYFNFKQHQISPAAYLPEWILPLFLDHLPFEACARVWDVLLLEGDAFLYRACLAILAVLEPRLFFPDRQELLELLRGQNKAALEVARREGRNLDGGKYEIYGLDEETLWERIDGMEDWWKESTWTRLLQRELPDL